MRRLGLALILCVAIVLCIVWINWDASEPEDALQTRGVDVVDLSRLGDRWSRAHRDALLEAVGKSEGRYPKVIGTFLAEDQTTIYELPFQIGPRNPHYPFNEFGNDLAGPLRIRFNEDLHTGSIKIDYRRNVPEDDFLKFLNRYIARTEDSGNYPFLILEIDEGTPLKRLESTAQALANSKQDHLEMTVLLAASQFRWDERVDRLKEEKRLDQLEKDQIQTMLDTERFQYRPEP